QALLRQALATAARENWREIWLADADFADWPLGERAAIEALQQWAGAGRQLRLLATHFEVFERSHARFVRFAQWRRQWDHLVEARRCQGAGAPVVPSALWTPHWCLQRTDTESDRGHASATVASRSRLREAFDEAWRQGRPAFPA